MKKTPIAIMGLLIWTYGCSIKTLPLPAPHSNKEIGSDARLYLMKNPQEHSLKRQIELKLPDMLRKRRFTLVEEIEQADYLIILGYGSEVARDSYTHVVYLEALDAAAYRDLPSELARDYLAYYSRLQVFGVKPLNTLRQQRRVPPAHRMARLRKLPYRTRFGT